MKNYIVAFLLIATFFTNLTFCSNKQKQDEQIVEDGFPRTPEGILRITEINFEEIHKKYPNLLVLFYGLNRDSHKFKEQFPIVLQQFKTKDVLKSIGGQYVALGQFYVEGYQGLLATFKIKVEEVPRIKLFTQDDEFDYKQPQKTSDYIVNWAVRKLKPAPLITHRLKFESEIQEFKDSEENVVIYVGKENTPQFKAYEEASKKYPDLTCLHTFEFFTIFNVSDPNIPHLFALNNFEGKNHTFTGSWDVKSLQNWIRIYGLRAYVEIYSIEQLRKLHRTKERSMFIGVDPESSFNQEAMAELAKAREYLAGKIVIGAINLFSSEGDEIVSGWSMQSSEIPLLGILDTEAAIPRKYKYIRPPKENNTIPDEPLTKEIFIKFYNDFISGKLEHFIKSEKDIPPESEQGIVRKVIGKTFKEEVLDCKQSVLLMFFSHQCKHCKEFQPIFESLAQSLRQNKGLKFAKMDSQLNEVEGLTIDFVPTIKFFKAGSKWPPMVVPDFTKDESVAIEFLNQHIKNLHIAKEEL